MADCKKNAKGAINAIMCRAAANGEESFNAYRAAHNAFVGTMTGQANAAIALIEPLLLIDKFIFDTIIEPQFQAVVQTVESTMSTIRIPFRVFASLDSGAEGDCRKFYHNIGSAMNQVSRLLTKDFTKLKNRIDEMDKVMGERTELIEALKSVSDVFEDLQIAESYQDFITKICPTISQ